ncbi:MAG: hypothetical protein AAFO07_31775 [Bacteroidota bacterium]
MNFKICLVSALALALGTLSVFAQSMSKKYRSLKLEIKDQYKDQVLETEL